MAKFAIIGLKINFLNQSDSHFYFSNLYGAGDFDEL
jgi:hypothetical protein